MIPARAPRQLALRLDSGLVIRAEGGGAVRLSPAAAFEAGLLREEHVAKLEGLISQLRARPPSRGQQQLTGATEVGQKRKSVELGEVQTLPRLAGCARCQPSVLEHHPPVTAACKSTLRKQTCPARLVALVLVLPVEFPAADGAGFMPWARLARANAQPSLRSATTTQARRRPRQWLAVLRAAVSSPSHRL